MKLDTSKVIERLNAGDAAGAAALLIEMLGGGGKVPPPDPWGGPTGKGYPPKTPVTGDPDEDGTEHKDIRSARVDAQGGGLARMKAILRDNAAYRPYDPAESGTVIHKRLGMYRTAPRRVFGRKTRATEKEYALILLVDVSGSMRWSKAQAAAGAVMRLVTDLQGTIPYIGVMAYNASVTTIKTLAAGKPWSAAGIEGIGKELLKRSDDRYCYGNHDGYALGLARKALMNCKAENKILLVLTDGNPRCDKQRKNDGAGCSMPGCGGYHDGKPGGYEMTTKQARMNVAAGIAQIGIGIGTDSVEEFYPHTAVVDDPALIYAAVTPVLSKLIKKRAR